MLFMSIRFISIGNILKKIILLLISEEITILENTAVDVTASINYILPN